MARRKHAGRTPEWKTREELIAARKRRRREPAGLSLEALAGGIVALMLGYLAVEGIMNDGRHPIHWLVTALATALGAALGQGIHRWKTGR